MKAFYAIQSMPSNIFKHSFDTSGMLVKTEVVLRYTGKIVREINYSGFNAFGLPTVMSYDNQGALFASKGRIPPVFEETEVYNIQYDGDNRVSQITRTDASGSYTYEMVNYAGNTPVEWNYSFSDNDHITIASNHKFTYVGADLSSEEVAGQYLFEDFKFSSQRNYTQITTFAYDVRKNFTAIETEQTGTVAIENFGNEASETFTKNTSESFTYINNTGSLVARTVAVTETQWF